MTALAILSTGTGSSTDIGGIHMPNLILWVIGLAAFAGALHTLWNRAVKPLLGMGRTIHATYEKVMEYDKRIGVVENNTKQLTRNSGSHLADAVYRIEHDIQVDRDKVTAHLEWAGEEAKRLNSEIGDVWKTLAARDTVKAALRAAEAVEPNKDSN